MLISSTIEDLLLTVGNSSRPFLNDIYLFMVSTQTVKAVHFLGTTEELLNVSPLLASAAAVPLSPTVEKLVLVAPNVTLLSTTL